jgi:hypothetical protein
VRGSRTRGGCRGREEPGRPPGGLIASEAPRLQQEFLQRAEQRGWPGAENIHETRKLTDQELRKEAENRHTRAVYGFSYMEPATAKLARLERKTRLKLRAGAVVGRGWDTGESYNAGPGVATSAGDNPTDEHYPIFLMSDGRQVGCTFDTDHKTRLLRHMPSGALTGAALIRMLQQLSKRIGVPLDISADLQEALKS